MKLYDFTSEDNILIFRAKADKSGKKAIEKYFKRSAKSINKELKKHNYFLFEGKKVFVSITFVDFEEEK